MATRADIAARKKAEKELRIAREKQALLEASEAGKRDAAARDEAAQSSSWAAYSGREGPPEYRLGDGVRTVIHTVRTEGRAVDSTKTALSTGGKLIGKGIEGGAWLVGASAQATGAALKTVIPEGKQKGKRAAKPGAITQSTAHVAEVVARTSTTVATAAVNASDAVVGAAGSRVASILQPHMSGTSDDDALGVKQWVGDVVEGVSDGLQNIKGSAVKGFDRVAGEGKSAAVGVAHHAYGRKVAKEVGRTADGLTTAGRSGLRVSQLASDGVELAADVAKETAKQIKEEVPEPAVEHAVEPAD